MALNLSYHLSPRIQGCRYIHHTPSAAFLILKGCSRVLISRQVPLSFLSPPFLRERGHDFCLGLVKVGKIKNMVRHTAWQAAGFGLLLPPELPLPLNLEFLG